MVRKSSLLVLALTVFTLMGCVYVPPDFYGGPPPPPRGPVPPPVPYYDDGPPPDGTYFGRRYARRDYDLPPQHRYPRMEGRTRYLEDEPEPEMADADDAPERQADTGSAAPETAPGGVVTSPSAPAPEPPASPKIDPGSVPVATRSDKAGRVKSPYPPFRELDVTGMSSGSLAKDPVSGKVFRLP